MSMARLKIRPRLAALLLAQPADKGTLAEWASRIGMSERSMTRLLLEESGLSFGRWRRQLHVILSLQRLARGESVQRVALDLGYENASGFITMFRKAVGQPPARYLADRAGGAHRHPWPERQRKPISENSALDPTTRSRPRSRYQTG